MNIILTGYRGTGKTTIGELLGRKLKIKVIDTDTEIEANAKMKISRIVSKKGWDEFRKIEKEEIEKALMGKNTIIAIGGGGLTENKIRIDRKKAKVILLKANPKTIATRIKGTNRPSLTGKGTAKEIEEVLKRREQKYAEIADITIDTTNITAQEAAEKIEKMVGKK